MSLENSLIELAYSIRLAVRPMLGLEASRRSAGKASSGDESFQIDRVAEQVVSDFISKHKLPVAYYSEDRGLVEHGRSKYVLVIDPIDGTRPAMAGFEQCVVSIALAPYRPNACLDDVSFACILELKQDRLITAAKGGKVTIREGRSTSTPCLSTNTDLRSMAWTYEIAGRPSELVTRALAPLIDLSSLCGGVFIVNSIAYSMTRLITGQLSACVDVGNRIVRDYPSTRDQFIKAGLGSVIGLFPYDIAGAVLVAEAAGCVVTDAYGKPLGGTPLLDTSEDSIQSCVAASNPVLHGLILEAIEAGMNALSSV